MKKIKFIVLDNKLSREEMKNIVGGVDTGLSLDPGREGGNSAETCNAYSGCPGGCIQRTADGGGWKYFCSSCCIA